MAVIPGAFTRKRAIILSALIDLFEARYTEWEKDPNSWRSTIKFTGEKMPTFNVSTWEIAHHVDSVAYGRRPSPQGVARVLGGIFRDAHGSNTQERPVRKVMGRYWHPTPTAYALIALDMPEWVERIGRHGELMPPLAYTDAAEREKILRVNNAIAEGSISCYARDSISDMHPADFNALVAVYRSLETILA